ncbi:hypothetical protein CKO15_02430 [Halorhodospira abdelmalekii]|uniref:DUF3006 domain-containing protein n=1 Tax=Halorhodospira abdelmalekii TaxID=421629 RepID=UPI0019035FE3|nr:DUF3006 domain-containing protein [Halorhodospira abdelmalekii]MBK1734156.1 hypothetical protein [Halorhodospira abdelmalekii]
MKDHRRESNARSRTRLVCQPSDVGVLAPVLLLMLLAMLTLSPGTAAMPPTSSSDLNPQSPLQADSQDHQERRATREEAGEPHDTSATANETASHKAKTVSHEATVDAVDEGIARLLVGPAGEVYEIAAERLPAAAVPGTTLRLSGHLTPGLEAVTFTVDAAATAARQGRVRSKLERLRQRSAEETDERSSDE